MQKYQNKNIQHNRNIPIWFIFLGLFIFQHCGSARHTHPEQEPSETPGRLTSAVQSTGLAVKKIEFTFPTKSAANYQTAAEPVSNNGTTSPELEEFLPQLQHLQPDRRLHRAARVVLQMLDKNAPFSPSATKEALWWNGIPDTDVEHVLIEASVGTELTDQLQNWYAHQKKRGASHYGVAHKSIAGGYRIALISVRTQLELTPLPRRVAAGKKIRIAGKLSPLHPTAIISITKPNGKNLEPEIQHQGRAFSAVVTADKKGIWQIEIIGNGKNGPEPIANFPVAVGQRHRKKIVIRNTSLESQDVAVLEKLLFSSLNKDRKQRGLKTASWSSDLAGVARAYSQEMAKTGQVAHYSVRSGSPMDRVRKAGFQHQRISENLARSASADDAHRGLMESPAHRANILDPLVVAVGIGVEIDRREHATDILVTQLFELARDPKTKVRNPKKAIAQINRYRKNKNLSPHRPHAWLMKTANRIKTRCFEKSPTNPKVEESPFQSIQAVSFMTNYVADVLPQVEKLYGKKAAAIGLSIAEGEEPDVVCVTILLGYAD